jgi:hypothetical protein
MRPITIVYKEHLEDKEREHLDTGSQTTSSLTSLSNGSTVALSNSVTTKFLRVTWAQIHTVTRDTHTVMREIPWAHS